MTRPDYGSIDFNRRWNSAEAFHHDGGESWSSAWGGTAYLWHCTILPRILLHVPTGTILELAPGYGRCTEYLRHVARQLIAVDMNPMCVEACRRRFAAAGNVAIFLNDGQSLGCAADHSIDFIFSWDSMVHAQPDALAPYTREFARVLKPGGAGFIHHSNYLAPLRAGGIDKKALESMKQGRADRVDAALFAQLCADAGLHVIRQETIGWSSPLLIDCMTEFAADGEVATQAPVAAHPWFMQEARLARRIAEHYGREPGSAPLGASATVEDQMIGETLRWATPAKVLDRLSLRALARYFVSRLARRTARCLSFGKREGAAPPG